ncbi:TetR/AcrR family transcriptional regulator [Nocardioides dilutus]
MAGNRERSLRAAVELLGSGGIRALTHGRVDAAAGLPRGSTSNHFRTRAALLDGVLAWMLEQQLHELGTALDVDSVDELVDALTALFAHMTGPDRSVTGARMVLIVEAAHDPHLREVLATGRRTVIDTLGPTLERLGAPDPQLAGQAIAACLQGLFLRELGGIDELDPRPVIDLVVRAAVAST